MLTLKKRHNYPNGGASYSIEGIRASIYVSPQMFKSNGVPPETIDIESLDAEGATALSAPGEPGTLSAKKAERAAQIEERKKQRAEEREAKQKQRAVDLEAKRAEREQARVTAQEAREADRKAREEARRADLEQRKQEAEAKRLADIEARKNAAPTQSNPTAVGTQPTA